MSEANLTRIKTIISALLAKANSTTHEGEAEAYLAKATAMMERYQVELFELGTEDPIGVTEGVTGQSGVPAARSDLQTHLASYYGAKTVLRYVARGKWIVDLIGPESARITTQLMTAYVWEQVRKQAKAYGAARGQNIQTATRNVAKALCLRIRRELAAREEQPQAAAPGTSFSLVVVNAVEAYIAKHYADLEDIKPSKQKILASAMDFAKDISLHHQVTTKPNLRLE